MKDKKSCDSIGLTVEGVVRLSQEIYNLEAKRHAAKTESDRKLTEFF